MHDVVSYESTISTFLKYNALNFKNRIITISLKYTLIVTSNDRNYEKGIWYG